MSHPVRCPAVQAEIERRSAILTGETAGKITVEFNLKDGEWTLGHMHVTFPKHRGKTLEPLTEGL